MADCPNINHPAFKTLETIHGRPMATLLYHMNGGQIPTVEQAKKLVSPTDKHITQVLNAIKSSLPAAVSKVITVVQNVPRGILGRDDLFLSLKEILNDKGINDELLINWAGINRVNPKAVQSESEITGIIEKKYNNLKKVESHPALKANKLALESFNKWVSALNKYPVAFRDMMLSHAIKYLDPQRRSKYVLQLSDVALTNAYGMVINKPHELNRIGKLYDQEVLRAVNEAGDHEPSASGNGYWVHIPRTANGNHLGYNSYEEAANAIKELEDEVAEVEKIKSKPPIFRSQEPGLDRKDANKYGFQDYDYVRVESSYSRGSSPHEKHLGENYEGYYIHGYNTGYGKPSTKIVPITKQQAEELWVKDAERYPDSAYESSDRQKLYNLEYTKTRLKELKEGFEHLKPEDWVKNSAQYKVNVELLRKLSPSTWCTSSGMAPHYVENYDNYLLIVDGVTVAGVEAGDKGSNGKVQVKEVTSRANNGMAPIDHLDDVTAFFEKHNLDTNNSSLKHAQQAKTTGKTDAMQHGYDPNGQDDEYERERDRQERWNIDQHNGEHEYDPPEYGEEPDWEGELQRQQELEAVQAITTAKDALDDIETNRLPVLTNFYALPQNVRDNEVLARRAVEFNPHNISHISPTVPFYNELAIDAITRQPGIYDYLSREVKNRPVIKKVYDDYVAEHPFWDDLPFSKTNNSQIQGYYDPKNDKVVVVANNTPVDDAAKVGIHEVAHRGMIRMAKELGGTKELNKILFNAEKQLMEKVPELLKRTGHKNIEALVKDYGFDINSEEGKAKLLTELAARWAETLVDKPKPSWWKEFLTSIANWIKRFTGKALNENEVNELVGGFVKYGTQQETKQQELFSQQPIPYREAVDRVVTGFKGLIPAYPNSRTMWNYYTTAKDTKLANGTIAKEVDRWIGNNPHLQSVGVVQDANNKNVIQLVPIKANAQYQLSSEAAPADTELNRILKDYAQNELGGKVNLTDQIVVDGKIISANAVTNVVNRTIDYVANRAKIDTLPEEVSHIWVHWLPKNSLLLADMLKDIKSRPVYEQVMQEYSSNSHYQKTGLSEVDQKRFDELNGKLVPTHNYLADLKNPANRVLQGTGESNFHATFIIIKENGKESYIAFPEGQDAMEMSKKDFTALYEDGMETLTPQERSKFIQGYSDIEALEKIDKGGFLLTTEEKKEWHQLWSKSNKNNGTVDEHKIALEAIGKQIAGAIVGQYTDKKSKNLLQRLIDWITGIFKGKPALDSYEQAAQSILNKDTTTLDLQQDTGGDNIFFQLSDDQHALVKHYNKIATPVQKKVMEDIYVNPHSHLKLVEKEDEEGNPVEKHEEGKSVHYYQDTITKQKFQSVTEAIGGTWTEEQQKEFELNTKWGNQVDGLLQDIILGVDPRPTPDLSDKVRMKVFGLLNKIVGVETADGSILLPQAILADPVSGIAGSIDILVVRPDGSQKIIDLKSSWSSVDSLKYSTVTYERGAGAKITQALTKEQSHNVQTQCYAKLAWLNGYKNADTYTQHIYLNVSNGKVTDVEDAGLYTHLPSAYRDLVDTIIPTKYEGKDKLEEWNNEHGTGNPTHTNAFREDAEDIPAITPISKITSIIEATNRYKEIIENAQEVVGFKPKYQTVEKIVFLIAAIDEGVAEAQKLSMQKKMPANYAKAYTEFIKYANEELTNILQYLGNKTHWDSNDHIRITRLSQQYVNTFQGVMKLEEFANPEQKRMLYDLQTTLDATLAAIKNAYERTVTSKVLSLSTNPNVINELNKDISVTSTYLGDISNSNNPYLELTDKDVKLKMEEVRESTESLVQEVRNVTNKLIKIVGKKTADIFDAFFQKDINGKKTGRMISMIGNAYWRLRDAVEAPLYNDDSSYKEYKKDFDNKESLKYNNELYYARNNRREFIQAEKNGVRGGKVYSEDGDYHKLSDSFKEDRLKWMHQNQYGVWVLNNRSRESLVWQGNHYIYTDYQYMHMDKKGAPTGIVETRYGWFPKESVSEQDPITKKITWKTQIETRQEAADGTDLVDPQYKALYGPGPKSPLQQAQAEFFDAYKRILLTQIEKLPPSALKWYNKGFIPTLKDNFLKLLASKDQSTYDVITGQMRDFFSISSYTNQSAVTGSGDINQSLPILYMGKLQDQDRLKRLQDQVGIYAQQKGKVPILEWQKEYKRLKDLVKHEESRILATELNPDLAEGLMAFVTMSENFHIMSGIEDQIQATKQVLSEMEFDQRGKKVAGKDSNAYRRFSEWVEMAFYYDNNYSKTTAEIVGKKLKNLTSLMSIPFKVFGGINNALIASINNNLDAYGGDFYDFRAISRMSGVFIKEALPGLLKTWSDHKVAKKTQYTEKKNGSKYEALAHKFNMVEHYQESQGKVDLIAKIPFSYSIMEGGEWMVQTKVGNAILDSIQMGETKVDPETGEMKLTGKTLSVYDAHDFDPNTGHSYLKEEHDFDPNTGYRYLKRTYVYLNKDGSIATNQKQEQHLIHNRIRETNKRIHGNYRPIDKVWIEKYWAGQLAMQFHKWVVPFFRARFRAGKWDENLGGGMYVEGRWNSAWALLKTIKDTRSLVDSWATLTEHQKNNVKKDLMDLAYLSAMIALGVIVKAAAEDIPEDDPYIKRFANYLQYEVAGLHSRAFQEVAIGVPVVGAIESYQLIKNPFAVSNSLKNFADVIQQTVSYPFIDDEARHYTKGPHKGELKLWKETSDLIPLWNNINQFEMLDNKNSFYIP